MRSAIKNCVLWPIFALSILLLPIDNFQIGANLFREFGTRPANFMLAIALFAAGFETIITKRLFFPRIPFFCFFLFSLLAWITMNGIILPFMNPQPLLGRSPYLHWILQYSMFLWMLLSLFSWLFLFKRLDVFRAGSKPFKTILILACLIHTLFFFDDLFMIAHGFQESYWLGAIQEFFGSLHDVRRPAGLASEPSLWASWILFVWPMSFFSSTVIPNRQRIKAPILATLFAVMLIILGMLSGSRTLILVFILQCIIALLILFSSKKGLRKKIVLLLIAVSAIPFLIKLSDSRLRSLTQLETEMSAATRIGSTVTSFLIFKDNLIFGVGLGQFSAYYGRYVPTFFLRADEVSAFSRRETATRASTFNLPLRIGAETGAVGFILFLSFIFYFVGRNISIAVSTKKNNAVVILLSCIGGVSFWFQQDQFAYQPAIMGIALSVMLMHSSHQRKILMNAETR